MPYVLSCPKLNFPINLKRSILGPFLSPFPHFFGKNIFKKKTAVTQNTKWVPNTKLSFNEPRKLVNQQTRIRRTPLTLTGGLKNVLT